MMNVPCLGYAGSCKMLGFVYSFLSHVSSASRLLKVLCVCVLGLSPVL